jgi:hypothetical protein
MRNLHLLSDFRAADSRAENSAEAGAAQPAGIQGSASALAPGLDVGFSDRRGSVYGGRAARPGAPDTSPALASAWEFGGFAMFTLYNRFDEPAGASGLNNCRVECTFLCG